MYYFFSSLLYVSGQNSGLYSIGNIQTAVSKTPGVCLIGTNSMADRTGGIYGFASVKMSNPGTCTITWTFAGTDTRAAVSKDMTITVLPK